MPSKASSYDTVWLATFQARAHQFHRADWQTHCKV